MKNVMRNLFIAAALATTVGEHAQAITTVRPAP